MKQVTMLVPDFITQKSVSKNNTSLEQLVIDEKSLKEILAQRSDYHQDLYFDDIENVQLLAIEDVTANSAEEDSQHNALLEEIARGKRVACEDGCCTGTIGLDGFCTCGRPLSFIRKRLYERMEGIFSIMDEISFLAEEKGQNLSELMDNIGFGEDDKKLLIDFMQELHPRKIQEDVENEANTIGINNTNPTSKNNATPIINEATTTAH